MGKEILPGALCEVLMERKPEENQRELVSKSIKLPLDCYFYMGYHNNRNSKILTTGTLFALTEVCVPHLLTLPSIKKNSHLICSCQNVAAPLSIIQRERGWSYGQGLAVTKERSFCQHVKYTGD